MPYIGLRPYFVQNLSDCLESRVVLCYNKKS